QPEDGAAAEFGRRRMHGDVTGRNHAARDVRAPELLTQKSDLRAVQSRSLQRSEGRDAGLDDLSARRVPGATRHREGRLAAFVRLVVLEGELRIDIVAERVRGIAGTEC